MGEYYVESIAAGRERGRGKTFNSRAEADAHARSELQKGRGVSIDRLTRYGQHPVAQKGLERTALAKGKGGKQFTKSFGKIGKGRKSSPYGIDFNFKMPKIKFGF